MASRNHKALHLPQEAIVFPEEWDWSRLDSVSEVVDCPHTTPKLSEFGPLMARSQDIRGKVFRVENAARVSEETYLERIKRSEPKYGDILYSREGTYFGIAAEVPPDTRVCLGQRMVQIQTNEDRVYFKFLRYWLNSEIMTRYIRGYRDGSVAERLNMSTIRALPIAIPPLDEQKSIAAVLGAFDDKIELNRQMNATLEEMARAIFKSWFVDFDPVRAKARGEEPYGMDAETAALFPDRFEVVNGREVPEGWQFTNLEDKAEIHDRLRIPLSRREREKRKGKYPYYGATSIMDYVNDYLFDGIYLLMAEDGSVIDSNGKPVLQYVWGQFWVNNHAHVLTGKNRYSTEQLLLALQQVHIDPYITGAVQLKINQGNMKRIPLIDPPETICTAFQLLINPLFQKIRVNSDEIETLAVLRDTLLPHLVSGRLRTTSLKEG